MSYKEISAIEISDTHDECAEVHKILSCEIAATETYREVISVLEGSSETWKLEQLMHDHEDAVLYWKSQIRSPQLHLSQSSSAWSKVIKAILSKTKIEKVTHAIDKLKDAELSETNNYKNLLNNSSITASQKSYIKTILLPAHESHLKRLERMSSHALELTR